MIDAFSRLRSMLYLPVRFSNLLSFYHIDNSRKEIDFLIKNYNSDDRFYHTIIHVASCLDELDDSSDLTSNPQIIELALWYHDLFYDTHLKDNELKSANYLSDLLSSNGVSKAVISKVHDLVMLTTHLEPYKGDDIDSKLMVDIDLSILGSEPVEFSRYEENIREEYSWVSDDNFRNKRKKFLEIMLSRDRIYQSDFFFDKYEDQARKNIIHSINSLNSIS